MGTGGSAMRTIAMAFKLSPQSSPEELFQQLEPTESSSNNWYLWAAAQIVWKQFSIEMHLVLICIWKETSTINYYHTSEVGWLPPRQIQLMILHKSSTWAEGLADKGLKRLTRFSILPAKGSQTQTCQALPWRWTWTKASTLQLTLHKWSWLLQQDCWFGYLERCCALLQGLPCFPTCFGRGTYPFESWPTTMPAQKEQWPTTRLLDYSLVIYFKNNLQCSLNMFLLFFTKVPWLQFLSTYTLKKSWNYLYLCKWRRPYLFKCLDWITLLHLLEQFFQKVRTDSMPIITRITVRTERVTKDLVITSIKCKINTIPLCCSHLPKLQLFHIGNPHWLE